MMLRIIVEIILKDAKLENHFSIVEHHKLISNMGPRYACGGKVVQKLRKF